jgi:hypothetical protein
MNKKQILCYFLMFAGLALSIAGCAQAEQTPLLIASYPSEDPAPVEVGSTWTYGEYTVVYHMFLELVVSNVRTVREETRSIATRYGGYVVSEQSWQQGDKEHASILINVPSYNFDDVRRQLTRLGDVKTEQIRCEFEKEYYQDGDWVTLSHITVHLIERSAPRIHLPSLGWNPLDTFGSAFRVFSNIIRFLVDVFIWVSVVAGPFILIGMGIRKFIRRRPHRESSEPQNSTESH